MLDAQYSVIALCSIPGGGTPNERHRNNPQRRRIQFRPLRRSPPSPSQRVKSIKIAREFGTADDCGCDRRKPLTALMDALTRFGRGREKVARRWPVDRFLLRKWRKFRAIISPSHSVAEFGRKQDNVHEKGCTCRRPKAKVVYVQTAASGRRAHFMRSSYCCPEWHCLLVYLTGAQFVKATVLLHRNEAKMFVQQHLSRMLEQQRFICAYFSPPPPPPPLVAEPKNISNYRFLSLAPSPLFYFLLRAHAHTHTRARAHEKRETKQKKFRHPHQYDFGVDGRCC